MRKYILLLVISFSIFALSNFELKAIGFGFYFPVSINSYTAGGNGTPIGYGIGLTMDTRIAKKGRINYRLNVGAEFLSRVYEDYWGVYDDNSRKSIPLKYNTFSTDFMLNIDHTIGFEIVSNKQIRFWAGPQIRESPSIINDIRDFALGSGLALVAGININFDNKTSFCLDMGYRYTYYLTTVTNYGNFSRNSIFMNVYVLYRFKNDYN